MILDEVYEVLVDRKVNPREDSYTSKLLYHEKGVNAILEKIGEECTELILAAKDGRKEDIVYEFSDLLYHMLVLLVKFDIGLEDIWRELERRLKERRGR